MVIALTIVRKVTIIWAENTGHSLIYRRRMAMGFWSSFLGNAAANAYRDVQKEKKANMSWNDLFHEISEYETRLNTYLESVGCYDTYTFDVEYVNNGNIQPEKRKMDSIRKKVEEYIKLGGEPRHIDSLDELDDCIEKVKYLKSKGCLHRQEEFAFLTLDWIKHSIEGEERNNKDVLLLLNASGNELGAVANFGDSSYVHYYDAEDSIETIRIDTAKSYNEYTDNLFEFLTVSLKFNKKGYYVYSNDSQTQLFYKKTIGSDEKVDVSIIETPSLKDWSMLVVNGMELLCSTELAEEVEKMYLMHNMLIAEKNATRYELAAENINNLSGVDFEKVCQQVIEQMGFETQTTKASGDGGIDLIAYNYQPLLSGKYIIQCKRYTGSVGEPIIRDLYGVVTAERANKGILMTTGHFTKSATAFAEGKPIELIDGLGMQKLFEQYNISTASKFVALNNESDKLTDRLNAYEKEFYEDEWNQFVSCNREFYEKLEEFDRATGLSERINLGENIIPSLKEYEAYIMASKLKTGLKDEQMLFSEILLAMNAEYDNIEIMNVIYMKLSEEDSELLDIDKKMSIGTDGRSLGAFWSVLINAAKTVFDYSCLLDILMLHKRYIESLGAATTYLIGEDDILNEVTIGYYAETHYVMIEFIEEMLK